jgi:hypothetical protein
MAGLVKKIAETDHAYGFADKIYRQSGRGAAEYADNRIQFLSSTLQVGASDCEGCAIQNWTHSEWPSLRYSGSGGVGTGGSPVNIFQNPEAAFNNYRNPILGLDTRDGGFGTLNGLRYWNMDFTVKKSIRVAESISLELQGVFANVLNHDQMLDPQGMALYSPGSFGNLEGSAQAPEAGGNRAVEVGARVRF